ncbi:MAG: hypothetical protein ACFFFG_09695 [Candidatus Thorarchaeota archaeon]
MTPEKDTPLKPSEEFSPNILQTRALWNFLWIFLTILAVETLGFVLIRVNIAAWQGIIVIDLGAVFFLILGALTLGYLYYTRYVKRVIIFGDKRFSISVGKNLYQYEWKNFRMVALAIARGTAGVKGFLIRIYQGDLESEYVDLPIYRFSKKINAFDLRSQIDEKISSVGGK